jgi:predicted transcriptional regulator
MPAPSTSATLKQKVHELADRLPDDATWEDVKAALAVIEDIEAGLAESDAGLGVDTGTLRERFGLRE